MLAFQIAAQQLQAGNMSGSPEPATVAALAGKVAGEDTSKALLHCLHELQHAVPEPTSRLLTVLHTLCEHALQRGAHSTVSFQR